MIFSDDEIEKITEILRTKELLNPNRSLENIESCGHPCKRLLYKCL